MSEFYKETTFSHGAYPSAADLNAFNKRIKNAFERISNSIAALFRNNVVVFDSNSGLDKVFYYDASATTYTDWTRTAVSTQTPYLPDVVVSTVDYAYFGHNDQFDGMWVVLGSPAGSTISPTWQYYNGSSWASVQGLSDGTTGFTAEGIVEWNVNSMTDWSADDLNTILTETGLDSVDRYWIRVVSGNGNDYGIQRSIRYAIDPEPSQNAMEVKPTDPASMAITVDPGYAVVNKKLVSVDSQAQLSVTAPPSNSRYTIIQLNDTGVLSIKNGTAAASPTAPVPNTNNIKLADILIADSTTTITTSEVTDQRIFSSL